MDTGFPIAGFRKLNKSGMTRFTIIFCYIYPALFIKYQWYLPGFDEEELLDAAFWAQINAFLIA